MLGRELGYAPTILQNLVALGHAARDQGDPERAKSCYREGLAMSRELGQSLDTIEILQGMAGLEGTLGNALRAMRLWGAAETLLEATGLRLGSADRELHERHLFAARSRVGESAWEAGMTEVRTMPVEDALTHALEEGDHA